METKRTRPLYNFVLFLGGITLLLGACQAQKGQTVQVNNAASGEYNGRWHDMMGQHGTSTLSIYHMEREMFEGTIVLKPKDEEIITGTIRIRANDKHFAGTFTPSNILRGAKMNNEAMDPNGFNCAWRVSGSFEEKEDEIIVKGRGVTENCGVNNSMDFELSQTVNQ